MPLDHKQHRKGPGKVIIFVKRDENVAVETVFHMHSYYSLFGVTPMEYEKMQTAGTAGAIVCQFSTRAAIESLEGYAVMRKETSMASKESRSVSVFVDLQNTPPDTPARLSAWIPHENSSGEVFEVAERSVGIVLSDLAGDRNEIEIVSAKPDDAHNFWLKCTHAVRVTGSANNQEEIAKIIGRFVFSVFK